TLLEKTGPQAHVDELVRLAKERGLRLEEGGLFEIETGRARPLASERDIYGALGIDYVPPELRGDTLEKGPFDLIGESDLLGLVHCHTTWSDGKASVEEMARAAESKGARYITITDHSRAAFYAGGLDVERLKRQWDEIDAVQDKVGIRILRGTEADILA